MSQLSTDCLNEIFEYLENDKATLCSCLLFNRLWCEISVRILWRSVWNCNTLIACLPNESKEILCKNGITISSLISKPPIFNYAAYCKALWIGQVNNKIHKLLRKQQSILSQNLQYLRCSNISLTSYPGAQICLRNLSELHCNSNIHPEFFYGLLAICRNIQTLNITLVEGVSNGLTDVISGQKNLKYLTIQLGLGRCLVDIIPSIPNTLIKFKLELFCPINISIPLSFMTKFTNLQELILSGHDWNDFKQLQYTTFPLLQILKFNHTYPRYEILVKFLKNNGKNSKEFYVADKGFVNDDLLNLAIAKFCPNLRKLSTGFRNNELDTFKMVFNSCQYLECIKIWCGEGF